jgi:hypothetical protein
VPAYNEDKRMMPMLDEMLGELEKHARQSRYARALRCCRSGVDAATSLSLHNAPFLLSMFSLVIRSSSSASCYRLLLSLPLGPVAVVCERAC